MLNQLTSERWFEQVAEQRFHWKRWAIVAALLAASVYIGERGPRPVIMAVLAVAAVLVFRRKPVWGLVAVVVAGLMIPFGIDTGTQTSLNLSALLVGLLAFLGIMDFLAPGPRRAVYLSAPMWPLIALIVVACVSFLNGLQPAHIFASTAPLTTQIGGLTIFVLSVAAFILAATRINEVSHLRLMVWAFLAVGAFYLASQMIPLLGRWPWPAGGMGSMFWTWVVALALSQAVFNVDLRPRWRLALLGLTAVTLGIGFFRGESWVSGWLPPLVAVLVLLWLWSPRVGLMATLLVAAYAFVIDPAFSGDVVAEEDYSIYTRDVARDILVKQVFPLSPLLGLGPANYYWYAPLFPILGWVVKFNSHNNYVDLLLQVGLVGTACFVWFAVSMLLHSWRLRRQPLDGFSTGYVNGAIAGLVATLVAAWLGDWLLPFVYNVGFPGFRSSVIAWLFLGGVVALERIVRRGAAQQGPLG